ncbi:MAG: adenylate/guanylate cyclase domain-containing protein [Solirubrobacterales bacterium]
MHGSLLTRAYRRLGRHYPTAFVSLELSAGLVVTTGTVLLLSFFYKGSAAEFGLILAVALGLTAIALLHGFIKMRPMMAPLRAWLNGYRDPASTERAWACAVSLPVKIVRLEMLLPAGSVIVISCVTAILVLELPWTAMIPLLAASMVSVGYAMILHYLTIEAGMRPLLIDINHAVAPRLRTPIRPVSVRFRLLAALPMINVITGLVVAGITGNGDEQRSLGFAVIVAIGVATTIALELTVLLSRSILSPLADLKRATDAVGAGDYSASVPVTTADEIGELASSFNQMVGGLRERERIREAFGTYLDEEVADYILSNEFDEAGFEAEVTIFFCDVKDFTSFSADAEARDVVARLNALFEVVVPVIAAEGGHVDKFEGDGLMAVFGAPEGFPDHAERAVRAALEVDRRVNREGEGGPFELGIGLSTGRVVAGSVGGGGRLNFSVIGDAVNVAARVEGATRRTGDSVLITEATRRLLGPQFPTEERGPHELKGIDRPVELFAPLTPKTAGRPVNV